MDKTASLDSIPTGLLADPQPYPIYCCIQQWGFGDSISLLGKGESEGDEGEVEGKKEGEAEDAAPACVPVPPFGRRSVRWRCPLLIRLN